MTLVKFNNRPIEKSFHNIMTDFFNDIQPADFKNAIPVNIKESKDAYQLEVIAPGMDKNDFKVNLDKNLLTISSEKTNEVKEENEKQIRREYTLRTFKRSFTIDENIDAANIDAKYVNGVLTLNFPKKPEVKAQTKEITIQ